MVEQAVKQNEDGRNGAAGAREAPARSGKRRYPLAEMQAVAETLRAELAPFCARIEIAGSIRRQRPECADVELVCLPTIEQRPGDDLFSSKSLNLLDDYILCQPRFAYHLDKNRHTVCGPRYKRLGVGNYAFDLFSVLEPAQFGVILLIRTGPAEFSRRMVTQRSKGGVLPDSCVVHDGGVYQIFPGTTSERLMLMPEEIDFFAACGLPYVEPERRLA